MQTLGDLELDLSLEIEAERGGLYMALERDLTDRDTYYLPMLEEIWVQLAIDKPQMHLLFDYSTEVIEILLDRLAERLDDLTQLEIDEFITYQIWIDKVNRGIDAFACRKIGELLLGFEWLNPASCQDATSGNHRSDREGWDNIAAIVDPIEVDA
jgi:hypothetical protein